MEETYQDIVNRGNIIEIVLVIIATISIYAMCITILIGGVLASIKVFWWTLRKFIQ